MVGDGACLQAVLDRCGGDVLLTASMDCTAKLWSAESGECLRTLEGHQSGVMSAAFSPDGEGGYAEPFESTANETWGETKHTHTNINRFSSN